MKETLKLILRNKLMFITAIAVDIAFFIAYGFYTGPVSSKLISYAALITKELSIIMAKQPTGLLKHLWTPEIRPLTVNLALLIIIFFAITYLIYNIFQGTNWWVITEIAGKKNKYHKYLLGFAKINTIWMAGYVVYKIIDFITAVRYTLVQKIIENTPNTGAKIIFAAALLLGITAFFSYPTLKTGTLFKTPLKKSLPILITAAVFYIAIQILLPQINKINTQAALIIGTALLFIAINFIKIHTTKATENVHTRT